MNELQLLDARASGGVDLYSIRTGNGTQMGGTLMNKRRIPNKNDIILAIQNALNENEEISIIIV